MTLVSLNKNPPARQLRLFAGVWFPLFFAFVGFQAWRKTGSLSIAGTIWGIAALVSLLCLAILPLARLLFVGIAAVTFPIGYVLSHVVLGTVFYGVLTPIGFLMRLAGRDSMQLKLNREAKTYWIPRNTNTPSEEYFRQY